MLVPEITNHADATLAVMEKGLLIALEGIDGSGHSTQARLLRQNLEKYYTHSDENGPIAVHTREPTDGPVGGEIREYLSGRLDVDPKTLALMFAADRMDHVETELRELVDSGKIVILDRYILSSLAYQGVEVKDDDWLRKINSKAPDPDLTILLDVSTSEALKRMKRDRVRTEIFERKDKLETVRQKYREVADEMENEGKEVYIIDGERPEEQVEYDVLKCVFRRIEGDDEFAFINVNKKIHEY